MPNWFTRGIRLLSSSKDQNLPSSSFSEPVDAEGSPAFGFLLKENLPTFPYKDLRQATQYFSRSNLLAQGEYGKVYKGTLANGCMIAIKEMDDKNKFDIERHILSHLQHPNIIKLFGYCIEGKRFLLVYEFMENTSLDLILFYKDRRMRVNWQTRLRICKGVARALHYLHEESGNSIIHRDVKASNVLLDKNFNPKLSDFCTCRPVGKEDARFLTEIVGTAGYIAPEYLKLGQLSTKVDVYSFGKLIMELATGKFNKDSEFCTVEKVEELRKNGNVLELVDPILEGDYSEEEAQRVIDLYVTCTRVCSNDRPKMSAVLDFLEGRCTIDDLLPRKECVVGNVVADKEAIISSPMEEEEEEDTPAVITVNDLNKALADIIVLQTTPTYDLIGDPDQIPETSDFFKDLKALALNTDFTESLLPEKQTQMLHLWESIRSTSPSSELLDPVKNFLDQNPELISALRVHNEQSAYLWKYDSVKEKVESTKREALKLQDRTYFLRSSIESKERKISQLQEEIEGLKRQKEEEETELEKIGEIVTSDIREAPKLARWLMVEFNQQNEARRMVQQASERIEKGQLDWKAIQKSFM